MVNPAISSDPSHIDASSAAATGAVHDDSAYHPSPSTLSSDLSPLAASPASDVVTTHATPQRGGTQDTATRVTSTNSESQLDITRSFIVANVIEPVVDVVSDVAAHWWKKGLSIPLIVAVYLNPVATAKKG